MPLSTAGTLRSTVISRFNGSFSTATFTAAKSTGGSQLTLNEGFNLERRRDRTRGGRRNQPRSRLDSVFRARSDPTEFTSGTINNAEFYDGSDSAFFGTNGIINNLAGATGDAERIVAGYFGVFNNAGNFTCTNVNGNAPFIDCVFNNSGTVTLQSTSGLSFRLSRRLGQRHF